MHFGKLYRDKQGALVAVLNNDQGKKLVESAWASQALIPRSRRTSRLDAGTARAVWWRPSPVPCGSTRVMGASAISRPVPL